MKISPILASLLCLLFASPATAEQPNIILFLVDDLGALDTSATGSKYYVTPAVERLAAEGTTFTNAYASYPRCVPSRFAIITGRNPARDKVPGKSEKLDAVNITVAAALKEGGYGTYFLGKWHLGGTDEGNAPEERGFDVNIGGGHSGAPASYSFPFDRRNNGREVDEDKGGDMPGLGEGVEGEMLTDRLTREADALIRGHVEATPDKPFFLELAHYGVHTPLEDEAERIGEMERRLDAIGRPTGEAFVDSDKDGTTKQHQDHPTYAAMVSRVDDSLGTLLNTLDELGIADNTVVVFTSDHGGLSNRGLENKRDLATSNLPLRAGKGHLFEGGIRVPLIVRWPGHATAGGRSDFITTGADHFPSFLQAAGLEMRPNAHVDGVSYLAAATGEGARRDGAVYWHNPRPRPASTGDHGSSAIRVGDYKLIRWYHVDDVDLFDLSNDEGEKHDLADEMPEKAEELDEMLGDWLDAIDAVPSRER